VRNCDKEKIGDSFNRRGGGTKGWMRGKERVGGLGIVTVPDGDVINEDGIGNKRGLKNSG